MTIARTGFTAILRMQLRTGWFAALIWIAALGGGYVATVGALDGLYNTPEDFASYEALTEDPAMAAINGTAYGADTLGGVAANEYGFIVAIAVPLMGLMLVNRHTRAQEERGLLELLRSRGVGARAPWSAATLVAVLALVVVGAIMAVTLVAYGVPADEALTYGGSIAVLGTVFAGVAVVVGQLVRRASLVTGAGIVVLGVSYVTRAIGDVHGSWWKWLSPLAWQQETRPFTGDPRLWPLGLTVVVAAALIGTGLVLAGRRDLGAAMFASRPGPTRASGLLRTTFGVAVRDAAGSAAAWIVGAFAVSVVFGAFTDDVADAFAGNQDLARIFGGGDSAQESYLAFCLLLSVLMAMGCLGQGLGRLRAEETGGRLEPTLARSVTRSRWLAAQASVTVVAAVLALLAGGLGLWLTSSDEVDDLMSSAVAYVPAVLVVAALGIALFGIVPRLSALYWAAFGYIVFVAFLGETLSLPEWTMRLSPAYAVGQVPVDQVSAAAEWTMLAATAVLAVAGFIGFRQRDIPR
ncbi:ABC transporter permease [Gordonia neofelifaecis]|uniref:Anibiotic ABC transporter efflux pump n=1 Tax=Gordonia neofelifaecis NRRL B-59395 TaxID=644548 RepID=F1YPN8_9ACTN|nr:anibiotic ABC transporter efflux pump [Gordonia neofelifaecis]EGD53317.1 anibiotic ABC transporter efflux pump [Gordonia neofelifaecis NRRL B-59395]